MAEITVTVTVSGGGGGGATAYQQNISLSAGSTNIIVSENGGLLPANLDAVVLSGPGGILQQGPGAGQYQVDTVSVPNEINLNTTPLSNLELVLYFTA